MTPSLTPSLVQTVRSALSGAKLAKFEASLAVLEESLTAGAWIPRGAVKARSGLYQGLCKIRDPKLEVCSTDWYCAIGVSHSLRFGHAPSFMENDHKWDKNEGYNGMSYEAKIARGLKALRGAGELKKVADGQVAAWLALCAEVDAACAYLDEARPLPKVTAIGLSPKVTKTLTEMNLDLDLPSIRLAKIEARWREWLNPKTGKMVTIRYHVVVWSEGIAHGTSRFADHGQNCHACGKYIPSGRFVPVEAHDKKKDRLVSLWLGCDCARNIFGIQDIGIEQK